MNQSYKFLATAQNQGHTNEKGQKMVSCPCDGFIPGRRMKWYQISQEILEKLSIYHAFEDKKKK
jgi:hypothetical protein